MHVVTALRGGRNMRDSLKGICLVLLMFSSQLAAAADTPSLVARPSRCSADRLMRMES